MVIGQSGDIGAVRKSAPRRPARRSPYGRVGDVAHVGDVVARANSSTRGVQARTIEYAAASLSVRHNLWEVEEGIVTGQRMSARGGRISFGYA